MNPGKSSVVSSQVGSSLGLRLMDVGKFRSGGYGVFELFPGKKGIYNQGTWKSGYPVASGIK